MLLSKATTKEFNRLYAADESFREYARQVYRYLDTMRVMRKVSLEKIPPAKLPWFLLVAATFINEGVHFLTYEFTDDYTYLRHIESDPWMEARATEYKYGNKE